MPVFFIYFILGIGLAKPETDKKFLKIGILSLVATVIISLWTLSLKLIPSSISVELYFFITISTLLIVAVIIAILFKKYIGRDHGVIFVTVLFGMVLSVFFRGF